MSSREVDHLLIGGGVAAGACAQTLREEGADGSILVTTREQDPPYNRPPISKGYLKGEESREDTLVNPASWYEDNGVELLTRTSVMSLDPAAKTATLSNKEEVTFGSALVATGAMVRRLDVEGTQLDGLHYLRALGNSDSLRRDVDEGGPVVCIGGSYIGSEVAATLQSRGADVTVLMLEDHPLSRTFGDQAGRFFRRVLEDHGVVVLGGEEVEKLTGEGDRVASVVTKSGKALEARTVVLGVGATPDVMLARKSGLEIGEMGGVRCDDRLRTSFDGVYAAGDMCEYDSVVHDRVMRIEHWDVAFNQGQAVARNMLGADKPYDVVPYFFSDLSDWVSLEYVGPAFGWDEEVVRGSLDEGEFTIFYVEGDRLRAALTVGRSDDLDEARELVKSGAAVDRDALAAS